MNCGEERKCYMNGSVQETSCNQVVDHAFPDKEEKKRKFIYINKNIEINTKSKQKISMTKLNALRLKDLISAFILRSLKHGGLKSVIGR